MGRQPSFHADDLATQTSRLHLRIVATADARELHLILNDPELHRFTGGAPLDLDEVKRRVKRWRRLVSPDGQELWLNWGVRLAGSGALIGYVQATVNQGVASIAYVIGRAYWGQGLASEATAAMRRILQERLGVKEVMAHIHPLHRASQQVARHAGLTPTGAVDTDGEEIWGLRLSP